MPPKRVCPYNLRSAKRTLSALSETESSEESSSSSEEKRFFGDPTSHSESSSQSSEKYFHNRSESPMSSHTANSPECSSNSQSSSDSQNLSNESSSLRDQDSGESGSYESCVSYDSPEDSHDTEVISTLDVQDDSSLYDTIYNNVMDRLCGNDPNTSYDGFMASDYMTGGWKDDLDVSDKKLDKLEKILTDLIEEMRRESPNVQKILESDLTRDEKKGALYKLDIMKNIDPTDPEYGKIRREIMKKLETRHALVQKYLADKGKTWEDRILALETTDKVKSTLIILANQLGEIDDAEYRSRYNKLEMLLKLPYNREIRPKSEDRHLSDFLHEASEILDSEIYKMDSVKKKILGVIANYVTNPEMKGCAIGLVGSPGTSKTVTSRAMAKALGLPFAQITLGSTDDVTTLLGADNTWVGSSCGDLAHAYMKMGSCTGVVAIDELDKSGKKIWNAINHIIDPETNGDIKDNYLRDVPMNCSKTIFVLSLNDKEVLPKYLMSRIIMIPVQDPSIEDKIVITKMYKIPRMNIPEGISFTDEAIRSIVMLSKEKGYREIGAYLHHILEALNLHVIMIDKLESFKHCLLKEFRLPFSVTGEHVKILASDLEEKSDVLTHMYL